jgi:hypothetical protein
MIFQSNIVSISSSKIQNNTIYIPVSTPFKKKQIGQKHGSLKTSQIHVIVVKHKNLSIGFFILI